MPPVCAKSSTVSIPPQEQQLTKRNKKACKQKACSGPPGPPSPPNPPGLPNGAKRQAKQNCQPILTLAGQRQRRANKVAYISRPNGIHIKCVVRHLSAPELPLAIPYLPGQEDLPHLDTECDSTNPTILENLAILTQDAGVNMDVDMDANTEPEVEGGIDNKELWDYDAKSKDEDEDKDAATDDISHATHPFLARWEAHTSTSDSIISSYSALNLLANATDEDVVALLGSLDDLHFASNNPFSLASHAFLDGSNLPYGPGGDRMAGQGYDVPSVSSGAGGSTMPGHTVAGSSRTHLPNPPNSANNEAQLQRLIDLMPPPRLPQTEIQTSLSSPATPALVL